MTSTTTTTTPSLSLHQVFSNVQEAVTSVQTFAKTFHARNIRVQTTTRRIKDQEQAESDQDDEDEEEDGDEGIEMVWIRCENSPACGWLVSLEQIASTNSMSPPWRIAGLQLDHHPNMCLGIPVTKMPVLPQLNTLSPFFSASLPSPSLSFGGLMPLGTPMAGAGNHPCSMYLPSPSNSHAGNMEESFQAQLNSIHELSVPSVATAPPVSVPVSVPVPVPGPGPVASVEATSHYLAMGDKSKMILTTKMRWISAKEASKAVNDYALFVQRKRARMDKKTSGGRNKKYICSCSNCGWFVRLIKVTKSDNWKISSMQLEHSPDCTGEAQPSARQLAELNGFREAVIMSSSSSSSSSLGGIAKGGKARAAASRVLANEILDTTMNGVKIPLRLAYRAKKLVLEKKSSTASLLLRSKSSSSFSEEDQSNESTRKTPAVPVGVGIAVESYKLIPSLLQNFSDKNAGSTVCLKKDERGRFKNAFVCPSYTQIWKKNLMQVYGLEVVSLDTPLYRGKLIVLLGKDGNLEFQTIAFALIPQADEENVAWFLRSADRSGGISLSSSNQFVMYVGYQETQVQQVLARDYPHVKRMFCMESILRTIQETYHVDTCSLRSLVLKLPLQETSSGFRKGIMEIAKHSTDAAGFLQRLNPIDWTLHANRGTRTYYWNTTGFEKFAQWNGESFLQPIAQELTPFNVIYAFLQHLTRKEMAKQELAAHLQQQHTPLTLGADTRYRQELVSADKYVMSSPSSATIQSTSTSSIVFVYKIGVYPKITWRVNLEDNTCSCMKMYQLGIPCEHFIAATKFLNCQHVLLSSFDEMFLAETYEKFAAAAVSPTINPLALTVEARVPHISELGKDSSVLPPLLPSDSTNKSSSKKKMAGSKRSWDVEEEDNENQLFSSGMDPQAIGKESCSSQPIKQMRLEYSSQMVGRV